QPTCEHAKLGVVVAGEHYGDSFHVCIARDKCTTHWKVEVAAKQKAAKLRDKGQIKRAATVEKKADERAQKERRERERQLAAWRKLEPFIITEAVEQVKRMKALTRAQANLLADVDIWNVERVFEQYLGKSWFKTPVAAWLVLIVANINCGSFEAYVKD